MSALLARAARVPSEVMMRCHVRPVLLLAAVGLVGLGACDAARKGAASPGAAAASDDTCMRCHGTPGAANAAPPRSAHGATDTTDVGVGAHQSHLTDGPLRKAIACGECHVVPENVGDPGHMDGATATLTFGALATTGGLAPSWNPATATCSNVYCHGASLGGGSLPNLEPTWTDVESHTQAACGTCHGLPPPPSTGHPVLSGSGTARCSGCHTKTVKPDGTIDVESGAHINGQLDFGANSCTACHGDANRAGAAALAPPVGTHGETQTTDRAVGAHQAHVADNTIRAAIACAECHPVPSQIPHSNGKVDVVFGSLATSSGAAPTWNGTSCSAAYCHGGTLGFGGDTHEPVWTKVDGTQRQCTSCHGAPPPPSTGHPDVGSSLTGCSSCHPGTVKPDGTIDIAGGKHINGSLDVSGAGCTACHGDANRQPAAIAPAPPRDTQGQQDSAAVGAHQAHLVGGALRGPVACSDCHAVPTDTSHSRLPLNLTWSSLATGNGATTPSFDATALTCANYCHGATLTDGSNRAPVWTTVDGTQARCGTCHGNPPVSNGLHDKHVNGEGYDCNACHGNGYSKSGTVSVGTHVNGTVEIGNRITSWNPTTKTCVGCHGTATWR